MRIHQVLVRPQDVESKQVIENIARAIEKSGRFRSAHLEISVSGDDIRLGGRVASYFQKQVAQTAAMEIIGTRQLVNEIEVE